MEARSFVEPTEGREGLEHLRVLSQQIERLETNTAAFETQLAPVLASQKIEDAARTELRAEPDHDLHALVMQLERANTAFEDLRNRVRL